MVFLTNDQRHAVYRLYQRDSQGLTYRAFRQTVQSVGPDLGYVWLDWCEGFVGIEPDGYTHTHT
jgi:hypothetical protein